MKRFTLFFLLLIPAALYAQQPIQVSSPYQYNKYVKVLDSLVSKNIIIPRVAAFPTPKQTGQMVNKQDTVCFWNGSAWIRIRKVTWPEDSVRYASKSGVRADTTKLHNQIITKLNASDTARYISKSQARKDIGDSIAPLRVDIIELQADTNYIKSFIRNHSQVEFAISANDTTVINVGSILTHELINIENYIIKLPSNYQSGSIRIMPKDFSLFVDNGRTIDTNGGQGIGVSILFALVDTDIRMSVINTNAETGTIKFTVNNIYADGVLINGLWNDNGVWLDSEPMF